MQVSKLYKSSDSALGSSRPLPGSVGNKITDVHETGDGREKTAKAFRAADGLVAALSSAVGIEIEIKKINKSKKV